MRIKLWKCRFLTKILNWADFSKNSVDLWILGDLCGFLDWKSWLYDEMRTCEPKNGLNIPLFKSNVHLYEQKNNVLILLNVKNLWKITKCDSFASGADFLFCRFDGFLKFSSGNADNRCSYQWKWLVYLVPEKANMLQIWPFLDIFSICMENFDCLWCANGKYSIYCKPYPLRVFLLIPQYNRIETYLEVCLGACMLAHLWWRVRMGLKLCLRHRRR